MLTLASMLTATLSVLFILVSLLMMLVILIQRPKGGGLSGAFGGAGGSAQAAFGAKTGDFLTWTTCIFFVLFLSLAMGLTWSIRSEVRAAQQARQPVGVATPATPAPAEGDSSPGPASPDSTPDAQAPDPAQTPDAPTPDPTAAEVVEQVIDQSTSIDEAQQILDNAEAAPAVPAE